MLFVTVQFPDGTDISSLVIDNTVNVEGIAGIVAMKGAMQNPELIQHTHDVAATGATGPATPTGD